MNKTIIINIGNSIIHIEEGAYEILMKYLNEIKRHFAKNADDFEIVKDIENRIAEMFADILLKEQKQVIEIADVSNVIGQMGSVEDFVSEDGEKANEQPVFANYSGIKKLYRDTDEGVIAGVCAGLGHYLNIEARWIRLVMFLLIFLGGAGVLVYLILWVAMPRAASRSERMQMRGEATNLHGYKKNFDDELAAFKANTQSTNSQNKPLISSLDELIRRIFKAIGIVLNVVGKLIGKIVAWFIILFGFGFLIFLIVALGVILGAWDGGIYNYFPLNILPVSYKNEFVFSAFFTAFIPVLALVLWVIKMIFSQVQISKYFTFLMLGVWIVAAIGTSFGIARVASSFNEEAEIAQTSIIKPYPRYVVNIDPSVEFSATDSVKFNLNDNNVTGAKVLLDKAEDTPFRNPKSVRLAFERADDGKTSVVKSFKSNGRNFEEALYNAQNISYKYNVVDSVFTLSSRISLKKPAVWRDQSVVITVKLPVGTEVVLNRDLHDYIKFFYFYCNLENEDERDEVWVMTTDGLKCKYNLEHPEQEE